MAIHRAPSSGFETLGEGGLGRILGLSIRCAFLRVLGELQLVFRGGGRVNNYSCKKIAQ